MRWRGERQSDNVEDRRGMPVGRLALGGGGTIIVIIIALLLGADPRQLLNQMQVSVPEQSQTAPDAAQDDLKQFVSVVLAETEDVWTEQLRAHNLEYRKPTLVLFSGEVESACGFASAAVGPFYCDQDEKVYLDMSFFQLMEQRLNAPGDFAQAYVIAHEVGHHVQDLLGVTAKVHSLREQLSEAEYNQLSVRLELQADFYAGVWAHHTQRMKKVIEGGDIDEALNAATAIGDDKLQQESQGRVVPDSFTHGTSEQRSRWFRRGYETGDMSQGDTFSAENL